MEPNTQEEDLVRADKYGWKLLVIGLLLIGVFFGFWIGRGTAPENISERSINYSLVFKEYQSCLSKNGQLQVAGADKNYIRFHCYSDVAKEEREKIYKQMIDGVHEAKKKCDEVKEPLKIVVYPESESDSYDQFTIGCKTPEANFQGLIVNTYKP